jgi:Histidinol phosphatase and related hydrolases of the PHP family
MKSIGCGNEIPICRSARGSSWITIPSIHRPAANGSKKIGTLDFVLGSVHFLERADQMFDSVRMARRNSSGRNIDEMYADYFRRLRELIATGLVDSLAHLDLIKIHGHRPTADIGTLVNETLEFIRARNLAIELSTAGWRKPVNELYPSDAIIELAMEKGIPFTTASDAHSHVQLGENFANLAHKMAEIGIRQVCIFEKHKRAECRYNCRSSCDCLSAENACSVSGGSGKSKPQTLGETLTRLWCKSLEVIAGKCPDTAHVCKMPLNFQGPAFQRGFAFPE